MDWANERWVRLYTRDTTTWKMLDWRARTVLMHLLRKVDRAGVLDVGDTGTMGLAAVLELPLEVVEPGIDRLLHPRLRVVVETPTAYVLPNFLDAQEAVQTTNHRSAEYRARKRDYALAAAKPAIAELVRLPAPSRIRDDVTPRDGAVTFRDASDDGATARDGTVTFRDDSITRGHASSQRVDQDASDRGDLPVEVDQLISTLVTKRDADITPRDETITPHHAASQLVTPILSDPKVLSPPARAIPLSTEPAPDSAPPPTAPTLASDVPAVSPLAIGRLAELTYRRVSDARIAVAAELGLPAPIPFPESTPSTQTRGLVELRARIREEGAQAPAACDRVVQNLIAQAREERHVDWLSDSVFGDKAWPRARDWTSKKRKAAQAASKRDPAPPPKEIPAAERAGPTQFAEARALLARMTSNDDDTPDPTPRRRKAPTT